MLYVEDNAVNVLVVRELVALRPNIRLHVRVDGRSGVAAALRDQPDLVLVDMQLPDIDGYEVLRRLRAQRLTAAADRAVGQRHARRGGACGAAGFDDYWTKPIDVDQFLSGLDRLAEAAECNLHLNTDKD